jgi:asparagine synthase (glutamine-hydrolysing)
MRLFFVYIRKDDNMCGILVSTSDEIAFDDGSKCIIRRGPDQQQKFEGKGYKFYFNRLAIMDLHETGMQPFENDYAVLVANAEIYNEHALKKHVDYDFKSTSDCEVLLPLYVKYGVEMFLKLDAEFAIVIYDKKNEKIVAARDPIGIRPLFYGYLKNDKKIVFASEAKSIISNVEQVMIFPPGHYYEDGKFIKFTSIFDHVESHNDALDKMYNEIEKRLNKGVLKRMQSDAPIGYLLSGGLDSSLVCAIANKYSDKPLVTFSIGMDTDPIDIKYARIVSKYLKTKHHEVTMSKKDVIESLDEVIYALESYDITTIRASIGMFIVSKYIHEHTDIKVLLTGEVSDELFGYKYTDYAPSAEAFQNESIKRMKELHIYDVLRADRCISYHSLEARVPFGDLDFVDYIMKINPKVKMNTYDMGKYILRKAYDKSYLPKEILYRQKAAFSDAVGHSMVDILKAYANEYYDDKTYEQKRVQYKPTPFTKEALLYREIFEKYYPNHEHLIKNYWMPNKTWEGCDVDDPSARFLKNYGESGK